MKFSDFGKTRFLLVLWLVSFIGLLLPVYNLPHYAAPMTCVTMAVVMQALRRVRVWGRTSRNKGLLVVRTAVALSIISFVVITAKMLSGDSLEKAKGFAFPADFVLRVDLMPHDPGRVEVIRQLSRLPGKYLIIVHYGPNHNPHEELVYNDADIDGSKIVWAREIGPAEDKRLLDYFKDRKVFLLDADTQAPKLLPYTSGTQQMAVQASAKERAH